MSGRNNILLTGKAKRIGPFYVMELLEQAREIERKGAKIVHLEIGEPDFDTPQAVKRAAIQAIEENRTFYTESLGLPALRQKIAEHYQNAYKVSISPERIIITNGTSGAFLLLSAVLLNRRRNLVLSDPGYPCYRNFGLLADARIAPIPISEDTGFEITEENLRQEGRLPHLMLVANPANPTGTVYNPETLGRLSSYVRKKRGVMVVDEIYSGLTYGDPFRTALSISDDIVVVDGFSKTYAMTGWRLGWVVVPPALVRPMQKVGQNVFISPPTISQYAAMSAFDCVAEVDRMRQIYRERRDFLLPELRRIGFSVPVEPKGAFYIYAGIERWKLDSMRFVEKALHEAGVALTPGYDFGNFRADSHVRFSFANSLEQLKEGCRRLEAWLQNI
ncbi:MAG TPA: pyridoxal phosphate-dependent aminotransferase [Syntrophorhabdales bacterium]|nr:pyridoxal phosphate-dependent aminotransferase [Syntrophorhabdales bacterium]